MFQTSPTSRRDSTPLLDKVKLDSSLTAKAKAAVAAEQDEQKQKERQKPAEDLPIVKYLDTQASDMNEIVSDYSSDSCWITSFVVTVRNVHSVLYVSDETADSFFASTTTSLIAVVSTLHVCLDVSLTINGHL